MQLKKILIALPLLASMMLFSSCGDYVGKEKTHPFFVKAGASKSAGNYKEAAEYFEEFLNVCPRSPLTHYELAGIYSDNLDDPFKAIYHYQRYLQLDKNSSDSENINKFIELSKRKAFEKLSKQFESAETSKAYAEAQKTKTLLDQYVAYAAKLRDQNGKLRAQNTEMRARMEKFGKDSSKFRETVQNLKKQAEQADPEEPGQVPAADSKITPQTDSNPDSWEKANVAASSKTSTAAVDAKKTEPAAKETTPATRTHKVVKGDTLYNLAKKYYGSSAYYKHILDANKAKLGSKGILHIGQELVLPPLPGAAK